MAHFAVGVEDFERGAFALPNRGDANEGAQGIDDAPAFADDSSHVFGRNLQLDIDGMRVLGQFDVHLLRIIHQRFGDVLDEFLNVHNRSLLRTLTAQALVHDELLYYIGNQIAISRSRDTVNYSACSVVSSGVLVCLRCL